LTKRKFFGKKRTFNFIIMTETPSKDEVTFSLQKILQQIDEWGGFYHSAGASQDGYVACQKGEQIAMKALEDRVLTREELEKIVCPAKNAPRSTKNKLTRFMTKNDGDVA